MTASVNKITSKSRANSPQGICNPRTIMRWFVFPFLCVPKHLGPEVMKAMSDINQLTLADGIFVLFMTWFVSQPTTGAGLIRLFWGKPSAT